MDEETSLSPTDEWMERLRSTLPEYRGYAEHAARREQDAAYRRHLSERLAELLPSLEQLIGEWARAGKVLEALPLERARERMRAVKQLLENPDYGTTLFFNERPDEGALLEMLYQYDLVLSEQVRAVSAQLESLREQPPEDLLGAAERLEALVRAVEAEFKGRCEVIRNWV